MSATIGLGRSRLRLGRDLRLVSVAERVLWLEGAIRLRPGQAVELIGAWPSPIVEPRGRVVHWRIIRLGHEGPIYRGCVRLDR